MATNLTAQQMAELARLFSTPVQSSDPNANAYMPEAVYMDGRTYDRQDSGYLGYDFNPTDFTDPRTQEHQSLFNGQGYDQYGQGGNLTNSGVFTGIQDSNKAGEFLTALAMMAAPIAMTVAGAGAAGAAGAGAAGGGAGAAGAGGMVNGAFLGEGALSGIGAWDGALAAAGAGGTGAMGAGADGLMNGLNGSDIMSDAFVSNGGVGAGGFGGTNGSYMSNLLSGSGDLGSRVMGGTGAGGTGAGSAASTAASAAGTGSNLLGIGSTLLGAAAGAKGQEQSSTQTKDIPEWLKPYITGDGGLLSQTQQQLAASRSPERMAMNDQIRNTGLGLMNAPRAGNPTLGWTFGR
jgi:hypothetical protein